MLWAMARLQGRSPEVTLWKSLAGAVNTTAKDMNEQHIANSIWAVVKLATADSCSTILLSTLPTLAGRVPAVAPEMTEQAVTNVIWAVAKLARSSAESAALLSVLPALDSRIPAVISEMTAQAVSNMMWATGQLSLDPSHDALSDGLRKVLPLVVARAAVALPTASPQQLANSCWGLALSGYHDVALFDAVAAKVVHEAVAWQPKVAELTLPSLLCAFGRLQVAGHDDMLWVTAKKLSLMVGKVNSWGLCALTWSYKQLDAGDQFLTFRHSLRKEVERRQLSEEDVARSRLGPESW
ncbi:unnamed protein product [Effrenium voratum]|nr:unnamed protein product [Effrenium voratum]